MQYNWKKNITIFLSSQAVSIFGSSLVQFAITAYITIQTQSGMYAMASILCATLPTFLCLHLRAFGQINMIEKN